MIVENIPCNISVWNVIIWWEINNLTLRLEFIAQWAFYSFLFWHRCNARFVIGFSLFSRDPDGRSISNFYRFVSLCIWWITLSAYTASNCFVCKNQYCNVPLINCLFSLQCTLYYKHMLIWNIRSNWVFVKSVHSSMTCPCSLTFAIQ